MPSLSPAESLAKQNSDGDGSLIWTSPPWEESAKHNNHLRILRMILEIHGHPTSRPFFLQETPPLWTKSCPLPFLYRPCEEFDPLTLWKTTYHWRGYWRLPDLSKPNFLAMKHHLSQPTKNKTYRNTSKRQNTCHHIYPTSQSIVNIIYICIIILYIHICVNINYGSFQSHGGTPKSSNLDQDLVLKQPWWQLQNPLAWVLVGLRIRVSALH